MKKVITLAVAMLIAFGAVQSAEAGRKTKNTAYILGGVLGGLILADALRNGSNAQPAVPRYRTQPVYEQQCWTEYRGYYDRYGRYVTSPFTVCDWVRVQ